MFFPNSIKRHFPYAVDAHWTWPLLLLFTAAFSWFFTSTDLNIILFISPKALFYFSAATVSEDMKFPYKAELQAALWPLWPTLSAPSPHLRQPKQGPTSSAYTSGGKIRPGRTCMSLLTRSQKVLFLFTEPMSTFSFYSFLPLLL